jgi:hypothetical protein
MVRLKLWLKVLWHSEMNGGTQGETDDLKRSIGLDMWFIPRQKGEIEEQSRLSQGAISNGCYPDMWLGYLASLSMLGVVEGTIASVPGIAKKRWRDRPNLRPKPWHKKHTLQG